jgi:stage II sporulation protein D
MTNLKPYIVLAIILIVVTLLVPAMLVLPFSEEKASGKLGEQLNNQTEAETLPTSSSGVEVAVYRTTTKQMEKLPLEKYVTGVVAAEMPADFEMEALKAQALTARTYIVRQITTGDRVGLPEGADTSDTEFHQVYKNNQDLKQLWGSDYNWKMERVNEAVQATAGQILTYNGQPIEATFFSTSNGFTENSEDYWSNSFPYLRSVSSPWDKNSPKFADQVILPIKEFERKLGVTVANKAEVGKITERTAGKRVSKVQINGKVLSGKEIREKLGLKSTDFSWTVKGENIVINTKGYGHGVGMSQYGANGMATEGKNYQQIVKHYYQGVEIGSSQTLLTAKK